jgi:hypothetical protein
MITYEQAQQIIISRIGDERGLVEEETLEKPYGWYFYVQSKKWIKTRAFEDEMIGSAGFLIERENGRVVEFGSGQSVKIQLEHYEAGFRYEFYILTILAVYDVQNTFRALQHLRLIDLNVELDLPRKKFLIHPTEHGHEFFKTILSTLPFTFPVHHYYFQHEVLFKVKQARWFEFELVGIERDELESMPVPVYSGLLPVFDFSDTV